jgi:isopenicillin N synthase-like dioxygenase
MDSGSIASIDLAWFRAGPRDAQRIGAALDRACGEFGFFYVSAHGIDPLQTARLMRGFALTARFRQYSKYNPAP